MKDTFDFPRFEDLQLGLMGTVDGYGCLIEKLREVSRAAASGVEEGRVNYALWREVGNDLGEVLLSRLIGLNCPNTIANRRKAYRALERATKRVCNVDIGP